MRINIASLPNSEWQSPAVVSMVKVGLRVIRWPALSTIPTEPAIACAEPFKVLKDIQINNNPTIAIQPGIRLV
jgi:hypothetical protein